MRYEEWQTECFVILDSFLKYTKISKLWQKLKKCLEILWYYDFTHVYHKLQSYDVWFLRYWAQQTEFFVILDNFLPIYPLKNRKIKILKKWKKPLEISFHTSIPKIRIICYTVPEIWYVTNVTVIFHFGLFFALLPP